MSEHAFDPKHRPNLLIIITDQERAVMHFPEKWSEKHLPAMTLLRNNGVEFLNGCCNTCMCSPSRSTLFSGVYPAQHGVTDTLSFGGKYSITEPTLASSFSNMAKMLWEHYDVQYRGKWHMSKGGMNGVHPEKALMQAEIAQYAFKGWTPPDAGEDIALPNFGGGYAGHDEHYIEQALSFVRHWKAEKAAGKHPRPFALVVSLVNPHDVLSYPDTYQAGGYVDSAWTDGKIQLPPTYTEKLMSNWKPAAQWQLKAALDLSLGKLNEQQGQPEAYINFYGNLMSKIDLQIAQLLEAFYERDEHGKFGAPKDLGKETLIVRLADHGEMGLSHGGLRQKAFNVYDETLRVPFIFSNPVKLNPTGKPIHTTQPAGLIDIIPTLAGLLGLEAPDGIKGENLAAAIFNPGGTNDLQESHLFTFDDVKTGNKNRGNTVNAADRIRSVRTKNWKYARYFSADGSYEEEYELYYIKGIEFFDIHQGADPDDVMDVALQGQPYEYVNLAYEDNPLFNNLPPEAQLTARQALIAMRELLKKREQDMLTGQGVNYRKKVAALESKMGTETN